MAFWQIVWVGCIAVSFPLFIGGVIGYDFWAAKNNQPLISHHMQWIGYRCPAIPILLAVIYFGVGFFFVGHWWSWFEDLQKK